jgi:hypothetical protein
MIKHTEHLPLEDKVRHAARHRRPHQSHAAPGQLRGFFPTQESTPLHQPRFTLASEASDAKQDPIKLPMRVLLRHAKTLKYLRAGERWTNDPKQARDFRNGWWATIHAFTMNPQNLVIHYEFEDDRYNLNIPVLGHSA